MNNHYPITFLFQDNASRVSVDTIQKVLKQMDSSIKNLEMDLKNAARSPIEADDRLVLAANNFLPSPMFVSPVPML